MTAAPEQRIYTPAEYLAFERAAEWKHEYIDGRIVAMTGASRPHNLITVNLSSELRRQLRGSGCETYANDMRVRVSPAGLYTYPDVVVACGEIRFEDAETDTLLNPVAIVEVLSSSTERFDRGEKFARYRRLESLQEYVLVAQDKRRVERYVRQGDLWVLTELSGPDDTLAFEAIDCRVSLNEIYDMVELPDGEPVPRSDPRPGAAE